MRVLITGTRFPSQRLIAKLLMYLDQLDPDTDVLIIGRAPGVDSMAERAWLQRSGAVALFPARWDDHGGRAGILRNQRMLDEGRPDRCAAFPGPDSIGTRDMMERCRRAGVPVLLYGMES